MSDFELSAAGFRALHARVKHMSWQGPADRRGALNDIPATEVVAAACWVWRGRAVSLAAPIQSEAAPGNPDPAVHQMTHAGTSPAPASGLSFAMDRLALNIHGNAGSHIDALCHVIFDGTLCNGLSAGAVTAAGATELSIEVAGGGIVGRGLLPGIPRVRGVRWLEPGDHVTADDLITAEAAQEVASSRAICSASGSATAVGAERSDRGTPRMGAPGCIQRPWNSSRNGGSRCWAATATMTQRRAPPGMPAFRCSARRQRDGPGPAGLAAIRRPRGGVRGAEPLVIPLRHRASPAPRRDRLARQPDRHFLNRQAGHPGLGRSTAWTDSTT